MDSKSLSPSLALRWVLVLALCLAFVPVVPAAGIVPATKTIYVDPVDGNDANDGLSSTAAVEHIEAALSLSEDGDSIELASGEYVDEEWPIDVRTGVTIYAADPNDDPESAIIDGGFDSQIMDIYSEAPVRLVGLTFTGGEYSEGGGALYVADTTLSVEECSFLENHANRGSAIYAESSDLTITDSDFGLNGEMVQDMIAPTVALLPEATVCDEGGAIYAASSSVEIAGSSFNENGAFGAGSAVFLGGCEAVIDDSEFSGNQCTSLFASLSPGSMPNSIDLLERVSSVQNAVQEGGVTAQAITETQGGAVSAVETYLDITDSVFAQNISVLGGAVWAPIAVVNIADSTFSDNFSITGAVDISGLGLSVGQVPGESAPYDFPSKVSAAGFYSNTIDSCEFTGNWGLIGAVALNPYAYLTNCVMYGNGDMPDWLPPVAPEEEPSVPMAMSVVFSFDTALSSQEADSLAGMQVMNTTIADNTAMAGVWSLTPGTTVTNSIVWNGQGLNSLIGATPVASDLETPPVAVGPLSVEPSEVTSWFSETPEFVDPEGGDYRLAEGSPCIDTGVDLSDFLTWDFDHVTRPIDGNEDGTAEFDVGAFEYDPWPNMRLGGADRYATSVAIAQQHFPDGADTVVLATGAKFADGLSSAGLAGVYDAPILLTDPKTLPAVVADEIVRLGAGRVVIVGGTEAVSDGVADAVADLGEITVDRIGGADRYETAAMIADEIVGELGEDYDGMFFVARGDLYADALTASPVAWSNMVPILLVEPGEMPDATVDVITSLGGGSAVIVGGANAVGTGVEASVRSVADSVERITGTDRYDTSAQFSMWAVDGAYADWSQIGIATGEKFPDALSGGAGVGTRNGVVLLTPRASMHASIESVISDNAAGIDSIEVFGGEAAVTPDVYDAIMALLATD